MPITVPELVTERLLLRAYSKRDIPDMVSCLSEWETVRYTSHIPHPYTIIDAQNYVAANQTLNHEGMGVFAIERKDDRQWIGAISLERRGGDPGAEPELGYVLGRAFWGKRYAREACKAVLDYAFTQLNLVAIVATVTRRCNPKRPLNERKKR